MLLGCAQMLPLQVIGEQSNRGGAWRKFSQTFFLAEQPNGYFVLNDICRYIKEEGDEEEVEADLTTSTDAPATGEDALFADTTFAPEPSFSATDNVPNPLDITSDEHQGNAQGFPSFQPEPTASLTNGFHHVEVPETPDPVDLAIAPEEDAAEAHEAEPEASAPVEEVVLEAASEPEEVSEPAPTPAPLPPATAEAELASAPAAAPVEQAPLSTPTPKSWASLAASNTKKWGPKAVENKGSSAAPVAREAPATTERPAAASTSGTGRPLVEAVLSINLPSCFVKGVVETIPEKLLREVLVTRFGPVRELDIVRSVSRARVSFSRTSLPLADAPVRSSLPQKACAFVEFERVDSARRAIQASMRPSEGGEGGVLIDLDGPGSTRNAMIHVVERKSPGERPVSTRGGRGTGGGDDRSGGAARGGYRSSGGRESSGTGASRTGSGGAGTSGGDDAASRSGRGGAKANRGGGRASGASKK